ncbi:MAG: ubiquinone/menaquinone biosynthesis methyltransferase [Phycisphaerae bacterium]
MQAMFDAIAPTYERVNRVASAGRDRAWRRRAVALAAVRPDDVVLDVACGTGDLVRGFAAAGARRVVGLDFAAGMLRLAADRPAARAAWCRADALRLPFAAGSFSIASCAFGVRNFAELSAGLAEMSRVLRPGGRVVVLEFALPGNRLIRAVYQAYFQRVLPRLGAWLSGDATGAYRYLPRSVSHFAGPEELSAALGRAGFERLTAHALTLGVAYVHIGYKP